MITYKLPPADKQWIKYLALLNFNREMTYIHEVIMKTAKP
jgi:hypothetical protein